MPISNIIDGEGADDVRVSLNAVINAVNNLGTAANEASSAFATAAQGATADTTASGLSSHVGNTSNPHSVTKAQVGLSDVTNDAQTKASVVPNTAPAAGQMLVGNAGGTAYAPVTASGDATLASTGAVTLASVNSNVGSFGSSTAIPAITVDAKGRITGVTTNTVAPAVGTITGLGTGVGTALAVNIGTAGSPVVNGGPLGTPSSGTLTNCTGLPISGLVPTGTAGQKLTSNGAGAAPTFQNEALRLQVYFSDQTTDWTTGTKVTFTWRFGATTLSSTPVDCTTAPTGSAAQFNVTKNGTTIYSTKPTIDAGETSTDTASIPAVLSTTTLANGDIIAIAIDQVGSTNKGKGGVITFVGTTIP